MSEIKPGDTVVCTHGDTRFAGKRFRAVSKVPENKEFLLPDGTRHIPSTGWLLQCLDGHISAPMEGTQLRRSTIWGVGDPQYLKVIDASAHHHPPLPPAGPGPDRPVQGD